MSRPVPRLLLALVVAYAASWVAYVRLRVDDWPVGSAELASMLGALGIFLVLRIALRDMSLRLRRGNHAAPFGSARWMRRNAVRQMRGRKRTGRAGCSHHPGRSSCPQAIPLLFEICFLQ